MIRLAELFTPEDKALQALALKCGVTSVNEAIESRPPMEKIRMGLPGRERESTRSGANSRSRWIRTRRLARRRFQGDRAIRLGVPSLVFMLVVDPLTDIIREVGTGVAFTWAAFFHAMACP